MSQALAALGRQLDPSREQAQDWARRELSDPAYADARPGWVVRLVQWVINRLRDLQVPDTLTPGRSLGTVLLLVLVVVAVVVVLNRTGARWQDAHHRRHRLPSQR